MNMMESESERLLDSHASRLVHAAGKQGIINVTTGLSRLTKTQLSVWDSI